MKPYTSQDSVAGGPSASQRPLDVVQPAATDLGSRARTGITAPHGLTATESPTVDQIPATSATTQTVGFGVPGTGYINSGTDVDWFRVHLTAGVRYTVSETASGLLSDPNLELRDASGVAIASYMHNNLVGPQISFTVATDGDYYLSASSHNGSTGGYSLQFIDNVKDDKTSNATLAEGAHALGALETTSDTDWYAVTLTAGVTYDFSLTGYGEGALQDPFLRLYSGFGSTVTFNDDVTGNDPNSVIHYTPPTSGIYFLSAGSSSAAASAADKLGAYDLHYAVSHDDYAGDDTTTGTVSPGGSVSGAIDVEGDHDWFAVTLQAGKIYNFSLTGSGDSPLGDGYLELISPTGAIVGSDDDNGPGHDPSLSYYVQTSGTYFISAEAFPNVAPFINTGGYTLSVGQPITPTQDTIAQDFSTTGHLTLGQAQDGRVDTPGDEDWYAVTLTANTGYDFDLKSADGTDVVLYLYDKTGQRLAMNDNFGTGTDSHLDFEADYTGTYYLSANAANGGYGNYSIKASVGDRPLLTDSIDWGTQLHPTGGVVHVYFAQAGEVYDGETSLGWNAYEIQQAMAALSVYSNYIPLTFVQVTDPGQAEFKLVTANDLGDGVLAYFNPPGTASAGVGVFSRGDGWSTTGSDGATAGGPLEPGGLGFDTLIHEFGHGLGLAHPFDNGGGSPVMTGVDDTYDYSGYGYENQGVYTIMSYNDGWPGGANIPAWTSYNHGFDATPMAIDIAALQGKYGATTSHAGNDTYYLDGSSTQTSYMSIWDTGGTDTLSAEHLTADQVATIDLRSATMYYTGATAGGIPSYVWNVNGGMTIDQGVVIENAVGHAAHDSITGNDGNNVIDGRGGGDNIYGLGGDDTVTVTHTLTSGTQYDSIDGGAGNDTVYLDIARKSYTNWYGQIGSDVTLIGANYQLEIANVEKVVFTDGTVDAAHIVNFAPDVNGTLSAGVMQGAGQVLTAAELGFTDRNDTTTTFYVQQAGKLGTADFSGATTHGMITVDGVQANTFTSAQLAKGEVAFVQDGTADVPANFTVAAFDGYDYSTAVTFNVYTAFNHGDHLLVVGTDGADLIDASAFTGTVSLAGGAGDDIYTIDKTGISVAENADQGKDTVKSSIDYTLDANVENLTLTGTANLSGTGNSGDNTILGNDGNNVLSGGAGGNDYLYGGAGDDTFYIDHAGEVATDSYGVLSSLMDPGGYDTIYASIDYDMGYSAFIEKLVLTGAAVNGNGNTGNNTLVGNDNNNTLTGYFGDDRLYGMAGNDRLDGQYGNDYLEGGAGSDTYVFGTGYSVGPGYSIGYNNDTDEVNNVHTGNDPSDVDIIQVVASIHPADVVVSRDANGDLYLRAAVPGFTMKVDNFFNGSDYEIQQVVFTADGTVWTADMLKQMAVSVSPGNDDLTGTDGPDTLSGGDGDDTLHGGDGNDVLDGGNGSDRLFGEAGDDVLKGGVDDEKSDYMDGGTGADTMYGDIGNDTYVVDNAGDKVIESRPDFGGVDEVRASISYHLGDGIENLTLLGTADINATGNGVANVLTGNAGNNVLNGGAGADRMLGGAGNDAYFVDTAGDVVVENANEGTDKVIASVDYTLSANVENLTLADAALKGTGNGLDNVITGTAGNNTLDGLGGNDLLSGGAGADRMLGGAGDDTYVIDDAGDRAVESHNGTTDDGGKDTVQSYVSFHLGAFIENLTLIGGAMVNATGNELDNVLTGNSNDNVINGGLGADTMMGGKGNDTYFVDNASDVVIENVNEGTRDKVISSIAYALTDNVENLTVTGTGDFTVTGNILNNILVGNAGNNLIDGSGGGDHMFGGAGNDTYIVDNDNDRVSEQLDGTHDDGGVDTVMASVTYHIFSFVENLTLTGTGNINATGNQWNNVLVGNSGNNVLNGQIGADTMSGGLGDDGYIVDNSGDVVIENANEGTDKVLSSVSYTLTNNVENLTLTGSANLNATGNSLDNILQGNAGNNRIDGGAGADRLFGGAGADTFVFSANSGADIIKDFLASDNDRIDVSAYTHGTINTAMVHASGGNTFIDFGGGNTVIVIAASTADVLAHMTW